MQLKDNEYGYEENILHFALGVSVTMRLSRAPAEFGIPIIYGATVDLSSIGSIEVGWLWPSAIESGRCPLLEHSAGLFKAQKSTQRGFNALIHTVTPREDRFW